jgi:hypothetical protein
VRQTLTALRQQGHRLAIASTKKGAGILRATEFFGITAFEPGNCMSQDHP